MLRFEREAAFEAWLQSCPLDPRSMQYSIGRGGDGLLTVQCTWRMPAAGAAPAAMPTSGAAPTSTASRASSAPSVASAASPTPARTTSSAPDAKTPEDEDEAEADRAEADRLQGLLSKMQGMVGSSSSSPAAMMAAMQSMANPSTTSSAQATLAATMLQHRSRDADGQPIKPSREEIRMMLGMAAGATNAFPKAPGETDTK